MMDKIEIKKLSEDYFRGQIDDEDEVKLFELLRQDAENMRYFRLLEQHWLATAPSTAHAAQRWDSLLAAIQKQDRAAPIPTATKSWRIPWPGWKNVAAILLLVTLTAYLTRQWSQRSTHYYTYSTPPGAKSTVTLPDGTTVWLNAGSTLRYATNFNQRHRRVELSGEGYFDVAKKNDRPFVVATQGYDVVVRGTAFDIQAYADDPCIVTALKRGSVEIQRANESITMRPGEQVSLHKATGKLHKTTFANDASAWINDATEYEDISLEQLARVLSRRYAVRIVLNDNRLKAKHYKISLRNKETLDDILMALQKMDDIHIRHQAKTIYLE